MSKDTKDTSKIDELREKCDKFGIQYAPQAGEKKLQELLDAYYAESGAFDEKAPDTKEEPESEEQPKEEKVADNRTSKQKRYAKIRKDALKLVRITCVCNDPQMKKHKGQIIRVENRAIGTVSKFIPFDGKPYHVPEVLARNLENAQYQVFVPSDKEGVPPKPELRKKFNIERLPPLTKEELEKLKRDQAARGSVEDE